MACKVDSTALLPILELLIQDGESNLSDILRQLYNQAMLLERERQGYANGFKNKQLKTRIGKLNLNVP